MATIADYFEQAELSLGAYALRLSQGISGRPYTDSLEAAGMSKAQATNFARTYSVIDQYTDPTSGFSATVFQKGGVNYLAIRGSEKEWADWVGTNLGDIGADGVAIAQGVALYNYYLRLTGTQSQVAQYKFVPPVAPTPATDTSPGTLGEPARIVRVADAPSNGFLSGAQPLLTVAGHSLGGHLAMMLSRMAPNLVGAAFTYNSPGFDSMLVSNPVLPPLTSTGFFSLLRQAELDATGQSDVGDSWNPQIMVHTEVQGDWAHYIGTTPGIQRTIFSESANQGPLDSHVIEPITDSLALYALLAHIDSRLNSADPEGAINSVTGMLTAASVKPGTSLESTLDALRRVFLSPNVRSTIVDERNDYWSNLLSLDSVVGSAGYSFNSIVVELADDLISAAANPDSANPSAIAYRYALKELNPFVLSGTDAASTSALYAKHNQSGELSLYDPVTRTGSLSHQWIEDRAAMLVAATEARIKDAEGANGHLLANTDGVLFSAYDRPEGRLTIAPNGVLGLVKRFISFGNDDANSFIGRSGDDHFYGGVGNDSLFGDRGVDWIEGGSGNDTLNGGSDGDWLFGNADDDELDGGGGANFLDGGAGFDTYIHKQSNRGFDYIRDDDGRIVIDGVTVTGGKLLSGDALSSGDRRFEYRLDGTTLYINGSIAVIDFQNGDLGISVSDGPLLFDDTAASGTGGILVLPGDELLGDPRSSIGSSGNDFIVATTEVGMAAAFAGSGRDVVIATRRSLLEGGAGADYLIGSNEIDWICGDFVLDPNISPSLNTYALGGQEGDVWTVDAPYAIDSRYDPVLQREERFLVYKHLEFSTDSEAAKFLVGVTDGTDLTTYWNDIVEAGGGNDWVTGGAGSDRLFGQDGDDFISADADSREYFEGAVAGVDVRGKAMDLYSRGSDDDYVDGGPGDDILTGMKGNDWLVGGDGNDVVYGGAVVEGGAGMDYLSLRRRNDFRAPGAWLFGGEGDDFIEAGGGDVVDAGLGSDIVIVNLERATAKAGVSISDADGAAKFVLGSGELRPRLEAFTFVRKGIDLEVIYAPRFGGTAKTVWNGWFAGPASGAEFTYVGGYYEVTGARTNVDGPFVPLSLVSSQTAAVWTKEQVEANAKTLIDGSDFDDVLYGSAADDAMLGGDGNDRVEGGAGDDFLDGESGNDILIGGEGRNILLGGEGNDELAGGANADRMAGGPGNDIYEVDDIGDVVEELSSAGTDTVRSRISYMLPGGVENLVLLGTATSGRGNFLNNEITGNSDANRLDGGRGNDILSGEAGEDTYLFGAEYGTDLIREGGRAGETDRVEFLDGLLSTDVSIVAEGRNLVVTVLSDGSRLVIEDWIIPRARVEELVFADMVIPESTLRELFPANIPPILLHPPEPQALTEDAGFEFALPADMFEDVDEADVLRLVATSSNGSGLPGWLHFDGETRTFYGTPRNGDVGNVQIRITATDRVGNSTDGLFSITVENVNDAPVLAMALTDQTVDAGSNWEFRVPSGTFSDEDAGDVLRYSASLAGGGTLPGWLEFDASAGAFHGSPQAADVGSVQLRVVAKDIAGAKASDDFTVVVIGGVGSILVGHGWADTLHGGAGDDELDGAGGDDWLYGGGGRDSIKGGFGRDRLFGEAGNDTLSGGWGADELHGDSGDDDLLGGWGDDAAFGDDGNDALNGNRGDDHLEGGAGNDTLLGNWGNDILRGGSGIDVLDGDWDDDYLAGGTDADVLIGGRGADLLQGNEGNDELRDARGNGLLEGGSGNDILNAGAGNQLLIGGLGADALATGDGADIIAFNAGDGQDTVETSAGRDNVLSLGGGIKYADLAFRKSANDLILSAGGSDQITFGEWYQSSASRSISRLQLIAEAMSGYNPAGKNTLLDNKVETFDFAALASAFDVAGQVNGWALTNALLAAHLAGSDTEAIGGDLAYQYGKAGSLSGIGLTPAQDVINASGFGTAAQTLRPLQDLQQGQIRLS